MSNLSHNNRKASKLSIPEVIEIRELYRKGRISQGELSRRFQVSIVQIGRIVRGEVWQQIPTLDEVLSQGELKESAARMVALQEKMQADAMEKLQQTAEEQPKADKMLDELTGKNLAKAKGYL